MGIGQPSDWVDDSGGERNWGKILLLGGGGCLVLIIAAAALSTWGVCSGVNSCCERAEQQHAAMVMPVQSLLDAVGAGDTQRAYLGLGDAYRDTHTQAEFDAFIAAQDDLFRGGTARVVGSRTLSRNGKKRVYLSVLIVGEKGRKGSATFLVRQTGKTNERGDPIPVIDDLFVGEPDDLKEEREITVAVQAHLEQLGKKDYAGAWEALDPEFTSRMDRSTFEAYVTSQGDLFGPDAHPRLRAVDSDGTTAEAKVEVVDLRKLKTRGTVVYGLHRGDDEQWRIREIRTEVDDVEAFDDAIDPPGAPVPVPADAGGAAADSGSRQPEPGDPPGAAGADVEGSNDSAGADTGP